MLYRINLIFDDPEVTYLACRQFETMLRELAKGCGLRISRQRTQSRDPDDWRYIVRREDTRKIVFGAGYTQGLGSTYEFVRIWDLEHYTRTRRKLRAQDLHPQG
jgi:hypothetical protein